VSLDLLVGGWGGGPPGKGVALEEARGPKTFGEQGRVVLTNATGLSLSSFGYSKSGTARTGVSIAPGFDYFVADNVSLGADVVVDYSTGSSLDTGGSSTSLTTTSVGVAPRVGIVFPVVPGEISLWPLVEVGYGILNQSETSSFGANTHNIHRTWIAASLPVLYHVAPPFFVGAGPYVLQELSNSDQNGYENKATNIGASFVLGGSL
jgi:hypothetical protein